MPGDPPKPREKPGIGKGVLQPGRGAGKFSVARFHPPDDLEPFVEHFWTVHWDLRGQEPHVQETLPYPSVHVVVERDRSEVVGVITGKFERVLVGEGRVFAAKFRPSGFHAVFGRPVSELTDERVSLDSVFEVDPGALEREVFGHRDAAEMVAPLAALIRTRRPRVDPVARQLDAAVSEVAEDRTLTTVAMLAERCQSSVRTLQRSFRRYIGVGPKWVIRRFRLLEAAEALANEVDVDFAALSAELGYADQAHFVRDFRALVGATPGAYVRRVREPPT